MSNLSEAPPRRHLTRKQADTVRQLLDAAVGELAVTGYADLTVRHVAARAGVAAATAYTYFSSKEHLVAEVFWRRLKELPPAPSDVDPLVATVEAVKAIALLVADEPQLAEACTVAMLSDDPEVLDLRARVGLELHSRLLSALGPDADERVMLQVAMQWAGATLYAGMGYLGYDQMAETLTESTARLLGIEESLR